MELLVDKLAEVRPPVGRRVKVSKLEILRLLTLLDLVSLDHVTTRGSIFDASHAAALERVVFLRSSTERMTRPMMRGDEAADYLPMQAIARRSGDSRKPGAGRQRLLIGPMASSMIC